MYLVVMHAPVLTSYERRTSVNFNITSWDYIQQYPPKDSKSVPTARDKANGLKGLSEPVFAWDVEAKGHIKATM
jgi:hypothetical protein